MQLTVRLEFVGAMRALTNRTRRDASMTTRFWIALQTLRNSCTVTRSTDEVLSCGWHQLLLKHFSPFKKYPACAASSLELERHEILQLLHSVGGALAHSQTVSREERQALSMKEVNVRAS